MEAPVSSGCSRRQDVKISAAVRTQLVAAITSLPHTSTSQRAASAKLRETVFGSAISAICDLFEWRCNLIGIKITILAARAWQHGPKPQVIRGSPSDSAGRRLGRDLDRCHDGRSIHQQLRKPDLMLDLTAKLEALPSAYKFYACYYFSIYVSNTTIKRNSAAVILQF